MRLTMRVRYGLRAIMEICENKSTTGVLQKDIAEAQLIPIKFLDAIISDLRKTDLLNNYSGKRSGYILARPASEISVYDVYRAFEPEITLADCLCPGNECERINICGAKNYWQTLKDTIKDQMTSSTLDKLVNNN